MPGFSEKKSGGPAPPKEAAGKKERRGLDTIILSPEEAEKLRKMYGAKAIKEGLQKETKPVLTPEQKAARQNETRLAQVIKKLDMQLNSLYTQDRKNRQPLGERLMAFDLKKGQVQELGVRSATGQERAQIEALEFKREALLKGRDALREGKSLPPGFLEALSSVLTERAETLQSAFANKDNNPKALELAQQNLEEISELFQWAEQKSPKG